MIAPGSKVKIHYTLTVEGEIVDSTKGEDPLSFEHGSGNLITGFEENIAGLKVGEKKAFEVHPDKAYGQRNPQAVEKIPLDAFKDPSQLKAGESITGELGGTTFQATIVEVGDQEVTLDLNHPLAGKTLNFDVEILEID